MNRGPECRQNAELLLEYSAGKLEPARLVTVEQHLRECTACRDLAASQKAVWDALDVWQAPPPAADFDGRLYRRIELEVSWWDRIWRPFRGAALSRRAWTLAAAAGVALMAGVIITNRPTAVNPDPRGATQIEPLRPDQAEDALKDMELLREFNGMVRPEAAESPM